MQVITGMTALPFELVTFAYQFRSLTASRTLRSPASPSGTELALPPCHIAKPKARMSDPLLPTLSLFAALSAAHHAAQRLIEARLPPGLNGSQFAVLERLAWQGEGQTPADIAQVFGWPKTSMSHTVTVLETRGLVRLERNPRDGRSKCLWLTPKGRALALKGRAAVEADLASIAALAPLDVVTSLAEDLTSLATRLDDQRRFPEVA